MSLGANFSSGYTDTLRQKQVRSGPSGKVYSDTCGNTQCLSGSIGSNGESRAAYQSMYLLSKTCPQNTPVRVTTTSSSVRTESLSNPTCTKTNGRFSQYNRYDPPDPCPALPQSMNMAGISLPSTRQCN
jgi:hypothetical protein